MNSYAPACRKVDFDQKILRVILFSWSHFESLWITNQWRSSLLRPHASDMHAHPDARMHAHTHACMHVCTQALAHKRAHACTCASMYALHTTHERMHARTNAWTHASEIMVWNVWRTPLTPTHAKMQIRKYACMNAHLHARTYTRKNACMNACKNAYMNPHL
jgi:hypothetical protein